MTAKCITHKITVLGCLCVLVMLTGVASAAGIKAWKMDNKAPLDFTKRNGWKLLEEGATVGGAVVLENDYLVLMMQQGAHGPVLFSKGAKGKGTRLDLAFIGKSGNTSAIKTVQLKSVGFEEGAVVVTSDGFQVEFKMQIGQPFIMIKSSKAGGFLEVAGKSRYVIKPSFDGNSVLDVVYDPAQLEDDAVAVKTENFILNCMDGNNAVVMCVWPTKSLEINDLAAVKLLLQGKNSERCITATRIEFLDSLIHVAILEKEGAWFDKDVSSFAVKKSVKVEWQRPFEALWRMDVLPKKSYPSKTRTYTFVNDPKSLIPASFKGKDTYLMMPGKSSNPYSKVVVYAIDRIGKTPTTIYTPVDIMRQSLGVGPCEYAVALEDISE